MVESKRSGAPKVIKVLIALHLLLLFYTLSGILSKTAAGFPALSLEFILLYGGMLFVLFVYAIGWQQIIKRLPLTVAFANKAITVVWGMLWGVLIFHESVNIGMIIGAILVIGGIVLYSMSDTTEQGAPDSANKADAAGASCEDGAELETTGDGVDVR